MEKELTCLRSIIADCDERITAALKTRMECIEGIITYKRENGLPVLQPEQEKKQLERVAAEVAGTVFEEEILHIFEGIIENSKRIQAKTLFDKNILLNGNMNVPFIQNLMESRREKYERAADIVIDTTGKEIETICEELLQKLSALRK